MIAIESFPWFCLLQCGDYSPVLSTPFSIRKFLCCTLCCDFSFSPIQQLISSVAVLENVVFEEHYRDVDYMDKSVTGI